MRKTPRGGVSHFNTPRKQYAALYEAVAWAGEDRPWMILFRVVYQLENDRDPPWLFAHAGFKRRQARLKWKKYRARNKKHV